MRITILCTDKNHPLIERLKSWVNLKQTKHDVNLIYNKDDITGGDILFLISCQEFIPKNERTKYKKVLIIHASDLPTGRGWSPHVWEIINGAKHLIISLISAEDKIDTGKIYKKIQIKIEPHELWDEINKKLFDVEIKLMDYVIESFKNLEGIEQDQNIKPTYYIKRTPGDSEIDPRSTLIEQFNKIRVMDPNRYPAFFELHGFKYQLRIEKINE